MQILLKFVYIYVIYILYNLLNLIEECIFHILKNIYNEAVLKRRSLEQSREVLRRNWSWIFYLIEGYKSFALYFYLFQFLKIIFDTFNILFHFSKTVLKPVLPRFIREWCTLVVITRTQKAPVTVKILFFQLQFHMRETFKVTWSMVWTVKRVFKKFQSNSSQIRYAGSGTSS